MKRRIIRKIAEEEGERYNCLEILEKSRDRIKAMMKEEDLSRNRETLLNLLYLNKELRKLISMQIDDMHYLASEKEKEDKLYEDLGGD